MTLAILAIAYGFCIIPSIMVTNTVRNYYDTVPIFIIFLSVWLIMPAFFIYKICEKVSNIHNR